MTKRTEALEVYFYKTSSGNEPVREWLKDLPREDKRTIGFDIKTVQYGYPIGMPLTRVLHGTNGLEEVRSNVSTELQELSFMSKIIQWYYYTHSSRKVKRHRKKI